MSLLSHTITGAAAAAAVSKFSTSLTALTLAFFLAVASHAVLDMIPHKEFPSSHAYSRLLDPHSLPFSRRSLTI